MLTKEERRFMRSWEEQRKGGQAKYYLLYIPIGTIVGSLGVFFIASIFSVGMPRNLLIIPAISFVLVSILTTIGWRKNERKWKMLIRREIDKAAPNQ